MITINATGDTTLHTAGKYCPEDILVKVPAGGGSVETSTVTIENIDGLSMHIVATVVENGVETFYISSGSYDDQRSCEREICTINNVKRESLIVVEMFDDFMPPSERSIVTDAVELVKLYRSAGTYSAGHHTTTFILKVPNEPADLFYVTIM